MSGGPPGGSGSPGTGAPARRWSARRRASSARSTCFDGRGPTMTAQSTMMLPDLLSILPLRDTVLFPQAVLPLAVARVPSVRLVDDALTRSPANLFQKIITLAPMLPEELAGVALNIADPGRLTDVIGASLPTLGSATREERPEPAGGRRRPQDILHGVSQAT